MKVEADFLQYYGTDIRLLFGEDPMITPRWCSDMLYQLPYESRFMKAVTKTEDQFTLDQHLLANLQDALDQIRFETSVSAMAAAGKEYQKVAKKRPKPMERPGTKKPEKKKPRFITGRELKERMGQRIATGPTGKSIHHTPECIKSKVNENRGERLNCSCPVTKKK